MVCQFLGDLGCEEAGMRKGDTVDLRMHRMHDVGMAMPEARNRSTSRGIDVLLAVAVDDDDAAAACSNWQACRRMSVQDAGHVQVRAFDGANVTQ